MKRIYEKELSNSFGKLYNVLEQLSIIPVNIDM